MNKRIESDEVAESRNWSEIQQIRETPARAIAKAQQCEPFDLVFSGLPVYDPTKSVVAICTTGASIDVIFDL